MEFMKQVLVLFVASLFIISCNNKKQEDNSKNKTQLTSFENKGHQLVYDMIAKVGNFEKLLNKKDVTYKYTYTTPDGKSDVSIEKYIFHGEYSYGKYIKHERTLADLDGVIEQGYNGESYWLKQNGEAITNEKQLKRVAFNRPTNFYWFAMMQKLLDPGLNYEHLGQKTINNKIYDIVKITFLSTDKKPTDIYQLYINQESSLVDQFLFTVADFGIMKPKLMTLEYEEIEGMLIPSKRKYKNSNWDAELTEEPWILVNWDDIKFNTGITKKEFDI